MNAAEHLNMQLGPALQALDGILDRIDYNEVRRLGTQLRNIPYVSDDWDFPPRRSRDG